MTESIMSDDIYVLTSDGGKAYDGRRGVTGC